MKVYIGLPRSVEALPIDPGRDGTHSADRIPSQEAAEHILPTEIVPAAAEHTLSTGNRPGTWWKPLYRPAIDPGRDGTHSVNQKLTQDVAEHTLTTRN